MSTHTADMLKLLQQLPLEIKIEKTKQRIIEWYEHYQGQVYISFSGGKDSTVLLHLAREIYKDIEAVFVDTGLEYDQIRDFVKAFDNVAWLKPKMRFDEVIAKYGYPIISKMIARYAEDARKAIVRGDLNHYTLKIFDGDFKYGVDNKTSFYNKKKWKFLLDAPFLVSNKCCDIMKKEPLHRYQKISGKKAIIGTMAYESDQRKP